jgi:DNA-binding NtrC family response regulator
MSLSMQQKLLKALDEKTFYPVGSQSPVKSEFTLISATCEDIQQKIEKKEFREDFFFRLSGFQFYLKPLSERPKDIDLLIRFFQKKSPRRYVVKQEAIDYLRQYRWPGNIRELAKVCESFAQSITGIVDLSLVKKSLSHKSLNPGPMEKWQDHVLNHGLKSLISQLEKKSVEDAMKRNNGKITACIKELKISSSAFYRILQEHQLQF